MGDEREFTVRDGLAWLGITWEQYEQAMTATRGRHGGPMVSALLAAREAQGTDATPAQVLARYDIDPANPVAAHRKWDTLRKRYDA